MDTIPDADNSSLEAAQIQNEHQSDSKTSENFLHELGTKHTRVSEHLIESNTSLKTNWTNSDSKASSNIQGLLSPFSIISNTTKDSDNEIENKYPGLSITGSNNLPELKLAQNSDALLAQNLEQNTISNLSREGLDLQKKAEDRILSSSIPNPKEKFAQFSKDLTTFETRIKEMGLPKEQLLETYSAIEKVLDSKGEQKVGVKSEKDRIKLATQMLFKAAEPTSSDQGKNYTCNVTTVLNRIHHREPAIAAKMVADLALTGKFTAKDGTTLNLHPDNLRPQGEALLDNQRGTDKRDFEGQISQIAAVNLVIAKLKKEGHEFGNLEYRQTKDGAKLISAAPKAKLNPEIREALGQDAALPVYKLNDMILLNQMLTGREDKSSFIISQSDKAIMNPPAKAKLPDRDSKATVISNMESLENHLLNLQSKGELPAIFTLHARVLDPPASEAERIAQETERENKAQERRRDRDRNNQADESNSPRADGHVALITKITPGKDGKPSLVQYDDQRGNKLDREITLNELWAAMHYMPAMRALAEFKKETEELIKSGKRISSKEINKAREEMRRNYEEIWRDFPGALTEEQRRDQKEFRAQFKTTVKSAPKR